MYLLFTKKTSIFFVVDLLLLATESKRKKADRFFVLYLESVEINTEKIPRIGVGASRSIRGQSSDETQFRDIRSRKIKPRLGPPVALGLSSSADSPASSGTCGRRERTLYSMTT